MNTNGEETDEPELTPREEIEATVWRILRTSYLRITGCQEPVNENIRTAILAPHHADMADDLVQVMACVDQAVSVAVGIALQRLHERTAIDHHADHEMIDQCFQEALRWG